VGTHDFSSDDLESCLPDQFEVFFLAAHELTPVKIGQQIAHLLPGKIYDVGCRNPFDAGRAGAHAEQAQALVVTKVMEQAAHNHASGPNTSEICRGDQPAFVVHVYGAGFSPGEVNGDGIRVVPMIRSKTGQIGVRDPGATPKVKDHVLRPGLKVTVERGPIDSTHDEGPDMIVDERMAKQALVKRHRNQALLLFEHLYRVLELVRRLLLVFERAIDIHFGKEIIASETRLAPAPTLTADRLSANDAMYAHEGLWRGLPLLRILALIS
jgi:hypothetical protein